MQVIGHNDEDAAPPDTAFMAMPHGLDQAIAAFRADQVFRAALGGADGDEKSGILLRNAERRVMR
jgi:hypothetical protein